MPDRPGRQVAARHIKLGSLVGIVSVVGWPDTKHVAVSERLPDHALRIVNVNVDTGESTIMTLATSTRLTNIQVASSLLASPAQNDASSASSR